MDGTFLRRLAPPLLDRGQILRPRLLGRLAQRWDRRATVVFGGPGFGKSTLLSQALKENLLAPRGNDHWLSITSADNDEGVLLAGIAGSLGLMGDLSDPLRFSNGEELAAAARSLPPGTCLTLDDLHELDPTSSAMAELSRFVTGLPLQCSLVLSSRVYPSLPLADWVSKGLVDVIDEDDLRYTAEEVEQVVLERGQRDLDVDHGGWPALVELGIVTGLVGSERYLREVVLARMSNDERRLLAGLEAIGGGDTDLLAAAANQMIAPETSAALRQFPMMQRVGANGVRPHSLWQPVLADVLHADERAALRRRAAEELLRRGSHDDALRLFAGVKDWDGVASVIADACKSGCTQVPFEVLDRWRSTLPHDERSRPEAKLVAGIAERLSNTFNESTTDLLGEAVLGFREEGKVGAEIASLSEFCFVVREQGAEDRLTEALFRLLELEAQGVPQVVPLSRVGRAVVAEALDDDEALLAELSQMQDGDMSRNWMARVAWLMGHSLTLLGRPEDGYTHAVRSRDIADDDFLGARYLIAYVDWWRSVTAQSIAQLPFIGDERERSPFDEVYGGSVLGTAHSYVGNIELASESLRIAQAAANRSSNNAGPRPEYEGLLCCAAAALAVAQGSDADAVAALRPFFNAHPATTPLGRRTARRWSGLVSVLLPEQREAIATAPYGPALADARAMGQWFVDLRSGKPVAPPLARPELRILNALPLRWAVEATARFAEFDLEGARRICEHLVGVRGSNVRVLLRELADRSPDRAAPSGPSEGAKRLLASVPVAPSIPLVVGVLGPLQVARGTEISDAPELRRERVRQVVVALAVLGPTSRESLIAALWPELDSSAGSQNLRTTLNYVHKLLEPDRGPGDAPFVVRQCGDLLSLVGSPWVESDVSRFHRCCDEAEALRRNGVHSGELEQLEEALSFVRGDPLTDVLYEEWASPFIRALTARISSASQRAAELRFANGDHARAQTNAELCLRFDPWSESANKILVTSLLAEGRMAAARDALRKWKANDTEFGVRDTGSIAMLERRLGVVSVS